jgi:hypothetical protein
MNVTICMHVLRFSSDEEVAQLVADLIPLSCVFMMADAITTGGVM